MLFNKNNLWNKVFNLKTHKFLIAFRLFSMYCYFRPQRGWWRCLQELKYYFSPLTRWYEPPPQNIGTIQTSKNIFAHKSIIFASTYDSKHAHSCTYVYIMYALFQILSCDYFIISVLHTFYQFKIRIPFSLLNYIYHTFNHQHDTVQV